VTCVECGGEMEHRHVTTEEPLGGVRLRMENLPAWVCTRCGRREVSGPVLVALEALADALAAEAQLGGLARAPQSIRLATR